MGKGDKVTSGKPSGTQASSMAAPLDERSVLASPYTPQESRNVFLAPVTMPLTAGARPSLYSDLKQIYGALVPPVPGCFCEGERHQPPPSIPHPRPRELDERDFREGLRQRRDSGKQTLPRVDAIDNLADYARTFETLLRCERHELLHLYERYAQYNIHIVVKRAVSSPPGPAMNASVVIPGIADVRPQIQPNDHVLVRPMHPVVMYDPHHGWLGDQTVEVSARVLGLNRRARKGKDVVYASWLNFDLNVLLEKGYRNNKPFNVRFVPSATLHDRMITALKWLHSLPSALVEEFLFPSKISAIPKMPHRSMLYTADRSSDLNEKQLAFVDMVLHRTRHPSTDTVRPPMCLTGPAGTGKTKALLEAIALVLSENDQHRILVCTPSHTAADVITRRLMEHFGTPSQLFRLYDADRPVSTVPVQVLPFTRQTGEDGRFCFPSLEELWKLRVIVCTCSDAFLFFHAGLTNQQLRARRRCWRTFFDKMMNRCDLSVSIEGVDKPYFTHLFVDEAAQAKEPETLIPLSVVVDPTAGARKVEVALVGDPRQLSPNVYSMEAAQAGLGQSLLERLLLRSVNVLPGQATTDMLGPDLRTMEELISYSFQEQLSVVLTMNYRGHPSFLMMPSVLFYFDKLQVAKGVGDVGNWCECLRMVENRSKPVCLLDETRKQMTWPIHFRGVVGKDASVTIESMAGSNSWSNREEAVAVVEIVSALVSERGVSSQSIGVMAPFRGQVVLIRTLLRERNMGGVDVGTIEDYQAVERDVIVLSLTRSTAKFVSHDAERRMGVFNQPKRTNVALTRAENLFVVVGSPDVMCQDAIWRQWLWFCLRSGLWYGESGAGKLAANQGSAHNGSLSNSQKSSSSSNLPQQDITNSLSSTLERLCRV